MSGKIRIGVVGLGRVANCHLHAIRDLQDQFELAALIDLNSERLKDGVLKWQPKHQFSSIKDALDGDYIDALVIALPHHLHRDAAIEALTANKHVLIEKPFARNVREATEIVEFAARRNLVAMGGQSRRYYDAIFEARRRLPELGRPLHLSYTWADCFSAEWSPPWWKSADLTGGLVLPLCGTHSLDYILWTMGELPEYILAETHVDEDSPWEGENQVNALMRFRDGSTANVLLSSSCCPEIHEAFHIGPNGSLRITGGDEHAHEVVGFSEMSLQDRGEVVMTGHQPRTNFSLQMEHFGDAIAGKCEPMASANEMIDLAALIDAAKISAAEKRKVYLDDPQLT